ncbi:MAG TPA: GNAT family N-acetyltransferase [Herpetosiphonaceae bacterium]
MSEVPLRIESQPAASDVEYLEDRINEFNIARTGIDDGALLSIFVRDEANAIQAGLFGWTWGECCEIRFLWVDERLRGQGYGTRLLAAAEREAAMRGCRVITLSTHSFQAPDFYQKQSYEVVGVLDDYPRGYQQYYLRKRLIPTPADRAAAP